MPSCHFACSLEFTSVLMMPFAVVVVVARVLLFLLLLLLQIRTQPHLGCCLAAATAAVFAIFLHLCTNSATPYTSRQHMRSCNDLIDNCANRRSHLTTAVAGHEKRRWASSSTGRSCIPKLHIACSHAQTKPLLDACHVPPLMLLLVLLLLS
jgi:hypothetical protein